MRSDLASILAARLGGGKGAGSGTGTDGRNAYVRFSASPDGAGMTGTWSEGQAYVGFTTARSAPTQPSELVWCRFVGDSRWSDDALGALLDCLSHTAFVGEEDGAVCLRTLRERLQLPASDAVRTGVV